MAVRLAPTHAELLGQGEGLVVSGLGWLDCAGTAHEHTTRGTKHVWMIGCLGNPPCLLPQGDGLGEGSQLR